MIFEMKEFVKTGAKTKLHFVPVDGGRSFSRNITDLMHTEPLDSAK